jgi:hypothetical protein
MKVPRSLRLTIPMLLLLTGPIGLAVGQPQTHPGIQLTNNRADAVVEFQRPLRGSELGELTQSGLRIYKALGGNHYLVRVSDSALTALQAHPLFVRISPVDISSKLSDTSMKGKPAAHAVDPDGTIRVMLHFYPDVDFGQANSTLLRLGLKPAPGKTDFATGNRLEAAGMIYDTLRSASPGDFTAGAVCVQSDSGPGTSSSDTAVPPPGGIFFYLVRAQDSCPAGQGPLGADSNGVVIPGRACP